jgi:FAD:protein FMN transferase
MRFILKNGLIREFIQLRLILMLLITLPIAPLPSQSLPAAETAPVMAMDRVVMAMGTELRLHFEGGIGLVRASEAALAESVRIESSCSTWDPASAWSRLNAAQGVPVKLDPEWITLLAQVKDWQQRTEGAFDPVLMALLRAFDVRRGGVTPSSEEIEKARKASGADLLDLDAPSGTARLKHPHAGVEEGGFLKGYALDRMRNASGAPSGWIDFGGQLLAWGKPRPVAIADPKVRRRARLDLVLQDASLSCSGTSERGRHLLDPRSGLLCQEWGATAVVAPKALTADVLSTALYVLGPDLGLAWAEDHDVAAAFLLNDGRIRMSRAFQVLKPTLSQLESR